MENGVDETGEKAQVEFKPWTWKEDEVGPVVGQSDA